MRHFKLIIFLFFISSADLLAQNRYDFASTYFGLEAEYIHETSSFSHLDKLQQRQSSKLPSSVTPRFVIGGTHFWGHADFYISIPLKNLRLNGSNKAFTSNEVFTAFRFLPIRSEKKRASPFLGVGFNSKNFKLKTDIGKSQLYSNWQWYPEAGISYRNEKNRIFELSVRYFGQNEYNNFIDRNVQVNTMVSPWSFSFAYKKIIDFTAGYKSERAQAYVETMHEKAVTEKALSGLSMGVGLNALIPLGKTELASRHPFFNDVIEGGIGPDIGVGYYFHKLDGYLRASFRPLKQEEEAFDYKYSLNRNSLAIEAFKFLGDYHGFAPFVGPFVSMDHYHLSETDAGRKVIDHKESDVAFGLVFGWDIRQTSTDYLILRTNLRYIPELSNMYNGYKFTAAQLEFNFIQIVFYPERYKLHKRKS